MLVSKIARWFLLVMEVWIAGPILYLCILSVSAILMTKKRKAQTTSTGSALASAQFNFAILIPAHNEEALLGHLLESLSGLTYPKELYTVYVVADNCTDATAQLARATGWVHVYERFNNIKRGKGYALQWLLQKLEEDQLIYDAYIILDADAEVVPTFLQSMAKELARGAQALQAQSTVLNASESPGTALRWAALTLTGHVRSLGRSGLGASSNLFGTGMCLSRTLLMRYPWQAFTVGEDYQYYLTLVLHGERVHYVPEAVVRTHMPPTFAQMRTQDIRWESWGQEHSKAHIALKLLQAGLKSRSFVPIEALVELLTPPFSFLIGYCTLTLLASLLVRARNALLLGLLLLAGLSGYVGTGLYLSRPPRMLYKALFYAPGFMIWKVWVYLVLSRSKKHTREWTRTSRPVSVD